ncbi:hypothetical protein HMPREF9374_3704 [Desmospora sp. 8437]|nr:hypothetical protein HMPREF9374_3704 [Desmospora sp. 8437]
MGGLLRIFDHIRRHPDRFTLQLIYHADVVRVVFSRGDFGDQSMKLLQSWETIIPDLIQLPNVQYITPEIFKGWESFDFETVKAIRAIPDEGDRIVAKYAHVIQSDMLLSSGVTGLLINQEMGDENKTGLSLFPLPPS